MKFKKALTTTQRKHSRTVRPAVHSYPPRLMCALVANEKDEKKPRRKAQESASLDKVKEKKGGALTHQEEEGKQNPPPPTPERE